MKLSEIATLTKSQLRFASQPQEIEIQGLTTLELAKPGDLSFLDPALI